MMHIRRLSLSSYSLLFGLCLTYSCPAAEPTPGNNKMGVINYMTGAMPQPAREALFQWQSTRYDHFIGGVSGINQAPDATHARYQSMGALYPGETWTLKETAQKHGYSYEDMLLHMKVNYTFKDGRYGWVNMARFDACESWYDNSSSSKGVFLLTNNDSVYTDATSAAWSTKAADVPITNRILLGYCEPFDQAEFQLATPAGSGIQVIWEYWNGSAWTALPNLNDGTNKLTQNGIVRFLPPGDWATKSEKSSRKKWWIRGSVSGVGTTPIASRIFGDDWAVPGQQFTWRGWDAQSPTRINIGKGPLEYNPTPPAGATARFRHQSRLLGLWTNNLHFGNAANIQNGERTWARYLVEASLPHILQIGANGLFFDDGAAIPTSIASPANWQSYTEAAGLDLFGQYVKLYREIRETLQTLLPGGKTCINNTLWDLVKEGDCFIVELGGEAHNGGTYYWQLQSDKRMWKSSSFDQLLPENNPRGVKGIYTTWDVAGSDFMLNGGFVVWDRSNRGPLTAIASYYILSNENTRFAYNTEGWMYWKTDEFTYVDAGPNLVTNSLRAKDLTSGVTKYLSGDFTTFPDSYNSSAKTLSVKIGYTGEFLPVWKVSNTQLATNDVIAYDYPSGTGLYYIREGHLMTDALPSFDRIVSFRKWFPAAGVDIGVPDPTGYNGGRRDLMWKTAAESKTAGGVQRRDFTKAIVVHAPGVWNAHGSKLNEYGNIVPLGGTYYPLLANGKTGIATTFLRLRTAEGVILMKKPIR